MIPFSKILEYASWIDFADDTRFMRIVQSADQVYIEEFYKNMDRQMKAQGK